MTNWPTAWLPDYAGGIVNLKGTRGLREDVEPFSKDKEEDAGHFGFQSEPISKVKEIFLS